MTYGRRKHPVIFKRILGRKYFLVDIVDKPPKKKDDYHVEQHNKKWYVYKLGGC